MRPYVRLLVERMRDSERPLSRNRHFFTFDNPQGHRALRISRHLESLAREIRTASASGDPVQVERLERDGSVQVRLQLVGIKSRRTAFLSADEFELLLRAEGVRDALKAA